MARIPRLTASREQRQNIIKLVNYLKFFATTPKAKEYDHSGMVSCTYGLAVKSGVFPLLTNSYDADFKCVQGTNACKLATELFGHDYYQNVIYGDESVALNVYLADEGLEQLEVVIAFIIKAYRLTEKQVATNGVVTVIKEVDTTKNKITARIEDLRSFIELARKYESDRTIHLGETVKTCQAEIEKLEFALSV